MLGVALAVLTAAPPPTAWAVWYGLAGELTELSKPEPLERLAVLLAGVLAAAIRVMDAATGRWSGGWPRPAQCGQRELRVDLP